MDSFLHGFNEAFRLILHLDPVLPEFVLARDYGEPEALAVGVGELVAQLRALQVDLRIDTGGA